MSLTLREKIALIYTLAGTQRKTAALIGVSHQKVGRVLHEQSSDRVLKDPAFVAQVDAAFQIHKDITRQVARQHALPFDPRYPVFIQRMPFKDGTLGDRVAAMHTHWLPDHIRNAWLVAMKQSEKFVAASVGSIVNLIAYTKRADALQGKKYRDPEKRAHRDTIVAKIKNSIQQQIIQGLIYTPYTPMVRALHPAEFLQVLNSKLRDKHSPSVGDPGTALASQILLQVDTRVNKDGESRDKRFRDAHPRPAKPRKARKHQARGKRRKASR